MATGLSNQRVLGGLVERPDWPKACVRAPLACGALLEFLGLAAIDPNLFVRVSFSHPSMIEAALHVEFSRGNLCAIKTFAVGAFADDADDQFFRVNALREFHRLLGLVDGRA